MRKLTPKQQRFVAEYLIDLNATQAAIRAGYKHPNKQGPRLLVSVGVAEAIAAAQKERSKRTEIDADYVLATIKDTIERCKQAEPVTYQNGDQVYVSTPDGEVAPAYKFDAGAVLRGAELLGRHLAMFTDNMRHAGKDGGPIQHEVEEQAEAFIRDINRLAARHEADKGPGETRH